MRSIVVPGDQVVFLEVFLYRFTKSAGAASVHDFDPGLAGGVVGLDVPLEPADRIDGPETVEIYSQLDGLSAAQWRWCGSGPLTSACFCHLNFAKA